MAALLLALPFMSFSSGTVPHLLKPGDLISADVFNEIFTKMSFVTDGYTHPSEIVGAWNCTVYAFDSMCAGGGGPYVNSPSGMTYVATDTVTFTDDGDGTYSYAASNYKLYDCTGFTPAETGEYDVVQNRLINKLPIPSTYVSPLQKVNPGRMVWEYASNSKRVLVCDRLNVPPPIPIASLDSTSGLSVNLSWTDVPGETSYRVMRKDSLAGSFAQVGTTTAGDIDYTDTVSTAGTYWYRVRAVNANGDSLGSNVIQVTLP